MIPSHLIILEHRLQFSFVHTAFVLVFAILCAIHLCSAVIQNCCYFVRLNTLYCLPYHATLTSAVSFQDLSSYVTALCYYTHPMSLAVLKATLNPAFEDLCSCCHATPRVCECAHFRFVCLPCCCLCLSPVSFIFSTFVLLFF